MKSVLVIPDGAADEPQDMLDGRTPLEAADVPNMDAIARAGVVGRADHVPASMPSGSDVGTMSLFGYDPQQFHTGRAPLEAAAQGIELGPRDWAVRCNLVTIGDGRMQSFTAEQIPNDVGATLIELLDDELGGGKPWEFHVGVSYRNLLLGRTSTGEVLLDADTETTPPHDITGQAIEEHLPRGTGAERLRALMDRSVELFTQCPENTARDVPATQVWLWGEGTRPALTPFVERFGRQGAVITAVDLLRGIGRIIGWDVVEVAGATGYTDTDYAAKGRAAIEALEENDLVVVHVEATDEASHEGDAAAKVAALERIDDEIVAPLHAHLKQSGAYRILVCPDHPTFLRTQTHSHGYVPFAMCGLGVDVDGATCYSEVSAEKSSLTLDAGYTLMGRFLGVDA